MSKNLSTTKVIFFVTTLDSGGLETYLLRFLQQYAVQFADIIIVCKGGKGGSLEKRFKEYSNINILKTTIGTFHPHHYVKLRTWLSKHKDYVLCDFTGNFAGPILYMGKMLGIRKRIVFYRSSSNRFKETFFRLKINALYNKMVKMAATDILSNSNHAFNFFFQSKIDSRFKVIFNGLDIQNFIDEKNDLREDLEIGISDFVIGHTGRYNPAKNHQTIINVAKILLPKYPNLKFILCGKGLTDGLAVQVQGLGYNARILLFENREDISVFLNTCDAFVFPSITEGQPNSLIEAWAKGLPFVASNIPSINEITPKEFKNYLVEPNNHQAIARKLEVIIEGKFEMSERLELMDWTKQTFDSRTRFEEFYMVLGA